ncbi:J-domain-containing protein [Metabacillus halosaccharovorans]|uniref:DnaJ family domain-containing protein n=1 Tax=Metabacillus halosaccharovorans TaxID=930124 RepID=UPI00373648FA
MDLFSIIAEDKIKKAIQEGESDNLPGQGKPLKLDDLSHIPQELRVAYKVLKNSNMLDDVDQLKKDISSIEDLLLACDDLKESEVLEQKKREKQLKIETLMKKRNPFNSPASTFYKDKILDRFK